MVGPFLYGGSLFYGTFNYLTHHNKQFRMILVRVLAEICLKMHYFCHKIKNMADRHIISLLLLAAKGIRYLLSITRNYTIPLFR